MQFHALYAMGRMVGQDLVDELACVMQQLGGGDGLVLPKRLGIGLLMLLSLSLFVR